MLETDGKTIHNMMIFFFGNLLVFINQRESKNISLRFLIAL